jgi:predicted phosphodiesterase
MSSRVALLADIHGNSPALQAVLEDVQQKECSRVFVLGDIINGVDPQGCIELLQTWGDVLDGKLVCIKGNAEAYLMTPDLDAIPKKDQPLWHEGLLHLIQWFRSHLSANELEWIRTFPDFIRWRDACLVHDSPIDRLFPESWHNPKIDLKYQEWFYHAPGIRPDMAESEWQKLVCHMEEQDFKQVFCAHTHIPFCQEFGDRLVCNVGSVGAPLDGDARGSWIMVEEVSDREQKIKIQRVEYDISLIHQIIDQTLDYPDHKIPAYREAYKKWLSTGIHWRAHLAS